MKGGSEIATVGFGRAVRDRGPRRKSELFCSLGAETGNEHDCGYCRHYCWAMALFYVLESG